LLLDHSLSFSAVKHPINIGVVAEEELIQVALLCLL
jgi:hypothetical protein